MNEMIEKAKLSYRKWVPLVLVIFLIGTTFGFGPLGINLYRSDIRKEELAINRNMNSFNFDAHNYRIKYYFEKEYLNDYNFGVAHETTTESFSQIELEVHEAITAYEGNYFLPFYKDFTVKYNAFLNDEGVSVASATQDLYAAKVEGALKIRVYGLCTISKAKKIAKQSVESSVAQYINLEMSRVMNK